MVKRKMKEGEIKMKKSEMKGEVKVKENEWDEEQNGGE